MTDLLLYGVPMSPFFRKVEAVLAHKNLPYDKETVQIFDMPDWYLEISPMRRVPSLRDRSVGTEGTAGTIADSSAICAYLERKYPDVPVYPEAAFDYGRALSLEEFADTSLAAMGGMHLFRPIAFPLFQGKEPDLETARETWSQKLPPLYDYLEAQLDGQKFFFGGRLSIADISVTAQMMQTDLLVTPPAQDKWPALFAHLAAMKAHPIFAANLAACAKGLDRVLPERYDLN